MKRKWNTIYLLLFFIFLLVEIFIAKFVHDTFVRPFVGDVLVVVLLYCLARNFIHKPTPWLPISIFLFAALIELLQLFHIVSILGLAQNRLANIIIGTTFDWNDIFCYFIGTLMIFMWQFIEKRKKNERTK